MPTPAGGTADPTLYTDLTTVKSALGKLTADDRDDLITAAIRAASRLIDNMTNRRFYADVTASARTYRTYGTTYCVDGGLGTGFPIDDLATDVGLIVEGGRINGTYTTLGSTLYSTGPDNAAVRGLPITELIADPSFLVTNTAVRITGRWGWPQVPPEVQHAAQLLAARLYRRKDSPQGVIASADWGAVRVSRTDPDVAALLAHLMIPVIV